MVNPFRGQNIGFAIPINIAKDLLPQLKEKGRVTRGWLGVQIQRVTPALAKSFDLDEPRGALVGDVLPDSPAAKAELERGDIILEFDGKPVEDFDDLPRIVASTPPGKEVKVSVLRDGKRRNVEIDLEQMPDEEGAAPPVPAESGISDWGFRAEPLSGEQARRMKLEKGAGGMVISEIEAGSPAEAAQLSEGDVILEVNRQPVRNAAELEKALERNEEQALLLVQRGEGASLWVTLERKK
jgi:serine protease Do